MCKRKRVADFSNFSDDEHESHCELAELLYHIVTTLFSDISTIHYREPASPRKLSILLFHLNFKHFHYKYYFGLDFEHDFQRFISESSNRVPYNLCITDYRSLLRNSLYALRQWLLLTYPKLG
jgi:hypothetical protein